MGRPKRKGLRIGKRLSRALSAILDRNPPAPHITARRELFSFVGKGGNIDQDICDGIGQLHALGLLDGYGLEPTAMRDAGRDYAELWWNRYSATTTKISNFQRASRSSSSYDGETSRDRRFARMDLAIDAYDKGVVLDLVQPGDDITPWAQGLIAEALLKRGKVVKFVRFPDSEDRARLQSLCRGLCALADGALPDRKRWAA